MTFVSQSLDKIENTFHALLLFSNLNNYYKVQFLMHNEFICRKSDSELSFHKVGGMIYPKLQLMINSNILKISSLPQKEMVLIQSMPTIILYRIIDIPVQVAFLNASLCYRLSLCIQKS